MVHCRGTSALCRESDDSLLTCEEACILRFTKMKVKASLSVSGVVLLWGAFMWWVHFMLPDGRAEHSLGRFIHMRYLRF